MLLFVSGHFVTKNVSFFLSLCCSQSVSALQREVITVLPREKRNSSMWRKILCSQISWHFVNYDVYNAVFCWMRATLYVLKMYVFIHWKYSFHISRIVSVLLGYDFQFFRVSSWTCLLFPKLTLIMHSKFLVFKIYCVLKHNLAFSFRNVHNLMLCNV